MSFSERMKDMIDKGLVASRDFAKKASEKAKELGEKGVLKLEIAQLESQRREARREARGRGLRQHGGPQRARP